MSKKNGDRNIEGVDRSRRKFIKGAVVAGGATAVLSAAAFSCTHRVQAVTEATPYYGPMNQSAQDS